jgi:hypothetical protein
MPCSNAATADKNEISKLPDCWQPGLFSGCETNADADCTLDEIIYDKLRRNSKLNNLLAVQ